MTEEIPLTTISLCLGPQDHFRESKSQGNWRIELYFLEQGTGTVSAFPDEFSRIMHTLKWDDMSKRGVFRFKLSHKVKHALFKYKEEGTPDFDSFVNECIRRVNNLRALGQPSRSSHPATPKLAHQAHTYTPSPQTAASHGGSVPMDLSFQALTSCGRKISDQEHRRPMDNRLCLCCSLAGYIAIKCPLRSLPRPPSRIAAITSHFPRLPPSGTATILIHSGNY
ncbi:hypothetical protein Q9L58_009710 [Maublancomyces gigas]|uniref:Uncharacterized protein n=1 Tax=Discina gigas TaxID=1032678 RepID=A0ABR3G681_9PEZI